MALSEILALVSLSAALLLVAQALPWSRPGGTSGTGGDALLMDLLHGAGLLDLATRSNMILLCHAILIALLGNAGLLTNKNAAADIEDPWWPATSREPELVAHVPTREIVHLHLVEKQGTWGTGAACVIHGRRHLVAAAATGEFHRLPAAKASTDGETVSPMDLDDDDDCALVADQDKNGEAEEVTAEWWQVPEDSREEDLEEEEEEEEEDLDEMNRRFEAFIAATKEKMRLEALHPSQAGNRAVLA